MKPPPTCLRYVSKSDRDRTIFPDSLAEVCLQNTAVSVDLNRQLKWHDRRTEHSHTPGASTANIEYNGGEERGIFRSIARGGFYLATAALLTQAIETGTLYLSLASDDK